MCAVVVTGVARSNTWRLRIAAKSSIASGAPLRFWGGGLGVLLALGVWYSTAGASVRMVGAGRGGGPCATAGRIFSARFESSRVLNGFVLLFCFFVQVFVAGGAAWQPLQAVRIVWPLPAGVLCAFALASCALCLWFLLAVGDGCVGALGVRALSLLINLWLVQRVQRVQPAGAAWCSHILSGALLWRSRVRVRVLLLRSGSPRARDPGWVGAGLAGYRLAGGSGC